VTVKVGPHVISCSSSSFSIECRFSYARNIPDLTNLSVENVVDMEYMFESTPNFNQDISGWNVASASFFLSMYGAATLEETMCLRIASTHSFASTSTHFHRFQNATAFNQDISNWDLSSAEDFTSMFEEASSFSQDLCPWNAHLPGYHGEGFYQTFLGTQCPRTDAVSKYSEPISYFSPLCYYCGPPTSAPTTSSAPSDAPSGIPSMGK
jgi:Mycoplasma protein of unknown function, DUF285